MKGELSLRALTKLFGEVNAVSDLSLDILPGELLVLLGPSGCGKTTTLRLIAGLEDPDSGQILMDGKDITKLVPAARDVSMVFQNYALFPHMNVEQNLSFGMKLRGEDAPEIARSLEEVARSLQLNELMQRRPSELSGGQRQRVALGRALVRHPRAFLLDEPLSNLDAQLRFQARAEIVRLQKKLGVTTVYVTHDQAEALSIGDRVAVLNKGRVEQVGAPQEIYDVPSNTFVAGFVGVPPMTLFHVVVQEELAIWGEASLPVKGVADGPAILGVRPEKVRIGKDTMSGPKATIDVVEPQGDGVILALLVDGREVFAKVGPDFSGKPGERVCLAIDPSDIHAFETDSGVRISR